MKDYEQCEAYQVKKTVDGICIGDKGEECKKCPANVRYKEKLNRDERQFEEEE